MRKTDVAASPAVPGPTGETRHDLAHELERVASRLRRRPCPAAELDELRAALEAVEPPDRLLPLLPAMKRLCRRLDAADWLTSLVARLERREAIPATAARKLASDADRRVFLGQLDPVSNEPPAEASLAGKMLEALALLASEELPDERRRAGVVALEGALRSETDPSPLREAAAVLRCVLAGERPASRDGDALPPWCRCLLLRFGSGAGDVEEAGSLRGRPSCEQWAATLRRTLYEPWNVVPVPFDNGPEEPAGTLGLDAVTAESEPLLAPPGPFQDWGKVDAALAGELQAARARLRQGEVAEAEAALAALEERLDKVHWLLHRFWWPAVRYGRGVATARRDVAVARPLLESLKGTPKWPEASVQLALCDVSDGRLDDAERRLAEWPVPFPALCYARALVHERRGRADAAREELDALERFGADSSSYCTAGRRLRAAIAQRTGNAAAVRDLWERHSTAGDEADAVTGHRLAGDLLARRLLRDEAVDVPVDELAQALGPDLPGGREFRWLVRGELDREASPEADAWTAEFAALEPKRRAAWHQWLARRLLRSGDVAGAERVFAGSSLPAVGWRQRALFVLRCWKALRERADAPRLRSLLGELGRPEFARHRDRLDRWRLLLEDRLAGRVAPEAVPAAVRSLWSDDREEREAAARTLLSSNTTAWSEEQYRVARGLAAVVLGQDDVVLEELGHCTNAPVDARALSAVLLVARLRAARGVVPPAPGEVDEPFAKAARELFAGAGSRLDRLRRARSVLGGEVVNEEASA